MNEEEKKPVTTEESLGVEHNPDNPRFRANTLPAQNYVAPEMQGSHETGSALPTPAWDGVERDPKDIPLIKGNPVEEVRIHPGTTTEQLKEIAPDYKTGEESE